MNNHLTRLATSKSYSSASSYRLICRGIHPLLWWSGLFLSCLFLLVFVAGGLLTPATWRWSESNLQVRFDDERTEENGRFSNGGGVGWSKSDLFSGAWQIRSDGFWISQLGKQFAAHSDFHIAGVSPKGVSTRVDFIQTTNGKVTTSFDRLIFVPTHGKTRLNVSPDVYITGEFVEN